MKSKSFLPSPSFNGKGVSQGSMNLAKFLQIVRSTIPYLVFLFFYFLNAVFHIQPMIQDLGCVHVHTINNIEEFLFGFHPHRLVSAFHNRFFDILSAIPYLIHYVIPVFFPLYLFIVSRYDDIHRFYWLMGWVMWAHYFLWLVFPHTPPWVIDIMDRSNTTTINLAVEHKEGCAFARLDKMFGVPFFFNMFNGNPIPYASFPSGHVAWPTVVHCIGGPGGNWFILYIVWMFWATLYTCHHYVLDGIGALALVFAVRKIVTYLQERNICNSEYKCRPNSVACPFHV